MAGKIFINYRRDDAKGEAARLGDRLVQAFGAGNVFMDVDNLLAGERFDMQLQKALKDTDVLLAVIGPKWMELFDAKLASAEQDYVRTEIAAALERKVVVIPVTVDRAPLPQALDLPEDIRELVLHQKHDIVYERFSRDSAALIDAIRAVRRARGEKQPQRWRWAAVAVGILACAGAAGYALTSNGGGSAASKRSEQEAIAYEDASQHLVRTLSGHKRSVRTVAFAPDGRLAVSSSDDATLKLWDIAAAKRGKTFELATLTGHIGPVFGAAFSPDGRTVVSGGSNTIKVWDVASGKNENTLTGHSAPVNSVAYSSDGRLILSGSADKTVKLWDAGTGNEVKTFAGHSDAVHSVAFSPDRRFALSGSEDKTIKLWDLTTGAEARTFTGHTYDVYAVAFSSDGRTAVSGGADGTLRLWDITSGHEIKTLTSHMVYVLGAAVSADGRYILAGGCVARGCDNGSVELWSASSGRLLQEFTPLPERTFGVAFSPDNRFALSGLMDGTLRLWDISEWTQTKEARN